MEQFNFIPLIFIFLLSSCFFSKNRDGDNPKTRVYLKQLFADSSLQSGGIMIYGENSVTQEIFALQKYLWVI